MPPDCRWGSVIPARTAQRDPTCAAIRNPGRYRRELVSRHKKADGRSGTYDRLDENVRRVLEPGSH